MHRLHGPHPSCDQGVRRRQRRVGDDRAEDEPAAGAGKQDVGVLAVPTERSAVCSGAIDERVVISEHTRLPTVGDESVGDDAEPDPQVAVFVVGGVARTRPCGPSGRAATTAGYARAATINARAPGSARSGSVDRAGLRNVNCMPALWPAALRSSMAFRGVVERLRRCHADMVEPGRVARGTQLIDVGQAEHSAIVARSAHQEDAGWSAGAFLVARAFVVSQALPVPQLGREADVTQQTQRSDLGRVDDDGLVGLA